MGLYNLFLAVGILFSVYRGAVDFQIFFLLCVFVAGVVGAFTASKRILYVQGLPAWAALALYYF
jgi:putative membrane protein